MVIYTAREGIEDQNAYESTKSYKNINKRFYSLCHKNNLVRAFEYVWAISNNIQDGKFINNFVKTKWPYYLEEALKNAFTISTGLGKQNILIHCPSGADGSSVMSSLALLILEPHYRTFEGFRTLIFKEWLFFQHNFIKRHALLLEGNNGEHVHG